MPVILENSNESQANELNFCASSSGSQSITNLINPLQRTSTQSKPVEAATLGNHRVNSIQSKTPSAGISGIGLNRQQSALASSNGNQRDSFKQVKKSTGYSRMIGGTRFSQLNTVKTKKPKLFLHSQSSLNLAKK